MVVVDVGVVPAVVVYYGCCDIVAYVVWWTSTVTVAMVVMIVVVAVAVVPVLLLLLFVHVSAATVVRLRVALSSDALCTFTRLFQCKQKLAS